MRVPAMVPSQLPLESGAAKSPLMYIFERLFCLRKITSVTGIMRAISSH